MEDARRPHDLDAVHAALWQELTRAPHDKHHEWRTPVLATVDGDMADARTVVLREADATKQALLIFSDARAGKVAQLKARPLGMLVLWSRRLSWQLRLRVRLSVQTDGLAVTSRWARLKLSPASQDYLSPLAPGLPLQAATAPPAIGPTGTPSASPVADERGHFAVLQAAVLSCDWLELHRTGHRRARFDSEGARWLVP